MDEMYDNSKRTSFFKKDVSLETALSDLNELIDGIECPIDTNESQSPIILIMGCPRSGSTLLLQWLAASGLFSYPSNLIARFYKNPYLGIRTQQALLEFDPLNQLGFKETKLDFSSSLGKTYGALGPSEYWYYWRTFFKFENDSQILSQNQLAKVDGKKFIDQLLAFEQLTNKPLALKGMLLNWHIPYLYSLNQKFIFINVNRDPLLNAQSLLMAREKFFGDRNKWYSFKPSEYKELKDESPITQVVGQVIYTRKAVSEGLSQIPMENIINIEYTDFCSNPKKFLDALVYKFNKLGGNIESKNVDQDLLKPFDERKDIKLSDSEVKFLREELIRLSNN
ncbi:MULTISPECIES: sulfotransferase [Aequorivita]|uniref:Sulfotransferase n=1 Tax=Aequorivita iocasae TaxID=2803865 RepID=A0ABX7DRN2_9FLAO|nr:MULTISPECIES: sulfotransferase [Aequorivita]QQX76800.1 sulfotransferase [Aequorivita iocasae]UCA56272.1 sulfotransferase [Aequorivita sp. F7]